MSRVIRVPGITYGNMEGQYFTQWRIVSLWNGREVPEDHEHAEEMKALSMMQEAFIEAIAKAEGKECFKTFDCNAGDHSDCCPATGNSIG